MTPLAALQVHSNPYAPYIIVAFILVTASLYCIPTLYRLLSKHSRRSNLFEHPQEDLYSCHDEAFLKFNAKV